MNITRKRQAILLFNCFLTSISVSAVNAETILAPISNVNLSEAPPPWAARPDAQAPSFVPSPQQAAETTPVNVAKPAPTPTAIPMPAPVVSPSVQPSTIGSEPLTLEDNRSVEAPTDSHGVYHAPKQSSEQRGVLQKLFKRKNPKHEEYENEDSEDDYEGSIDTASSASTESNTGSGIESWYKNRQTQVGIQQDSGQNIDQLAAQGDSSAQYKLGLMYRSGAGKEQNIYQAIHWLKRAAQANNAQAQYALAMLYRETASHPQDDQKALRWYQQAAQSGHPEAQYSLGLLYQNGDIVGQNAAEAQRWFERSAEQGNLAAKIALAESKQSPSQATQQPVNQATQLAAVPPQASANQYTTPIPLENPSVTELSTPSQTKFVQQPTAPKPRAAPKPAPAPVPQLAQEEPHEQIRVASITQPPRQQPRRPEVAPVKVEPVAQPKRTTPSVPPSGVDNAPVVAEIAGGSDIDVESIRKGALSGDANSQLLYGSLYEDGQGGMQQDYAKAAEWYRKAADQGFAKAQYNLGLLYEDGKGMEQDYYEAAQWYKRAANNGFSEAQNNLGVLYIMGKGVIQDRNRAELMFRRASEQGNANAARNLKMLLKGK